jgi:hypothetical protein
MLIADDQRFWRRSSRCESGSCVEVAITRAEVYVRSSDDPDVELKFSRSEWVEFLAAVKEGELTG